MTFNAVSAVTAAVLTSIAAAAPRESVTFTMVDSVDLAGSPLNQSRTATFAGSDAGGAYTARSLTVTGSLFDSFGTSTWAREAVIQVTPPGGLPFVCIPFDSGTYVGITSVGQGRYTVPIGSFSTAGVWTFRFAETYDDDPGFVDQTWQSVTVTLDDAPPPELDAPIGGISTAFTSVNSDGVRGSGSTVLTHAFSNPGNVNRVQIIGRLTVKSLVSADNVNNLPGQARVRIIPPASTGLPPFDTSPVTSGFSTCLVNAIFDMPGAPTAGVPLAGTWGFEFYEAVDEPTGIDAVWQDVSFTFQTTNAPAAVNLNTLPSGGDTVEDSDFQSVSVSPQAGAVKWFKFTLPREVSVLSGGALDIDMVGTNATPQNDFALGLYTGWGELIAWSYNTGPGLLPQISVGPGTRTRVGDGLPYDGQNSATSPLSSTANAWPTVPVGTNYIAVCSGDDGAVFTQSGWQVAPSTESNGPAANLRIRYYINAPTVTPPDVTDLPALSGTLRGVVTLGADPGSRFKWLRFTVPEAANNFTGRYLDIDTMSTLAPTNDTSIALYTEDGNLVAFNNDGNPYGDAANYSARNSALSFGASNPVRDYRLANGNIPIASGQFGTLTVGTYYLQISQCCAGYGADRFWVMNDYVTNLAVGTVKWNIYTNFGLGCGPSDVGRQGGIAGSDGHLDSNDFIVFIAQFFAQSGIADVGSQAGLPGHDGIFDNNDFVVFIDQFFAGPELCR